MLRPDIGFARSWREALGNRDADLKILTNVSY